jgi:asparagine synthase (glutamine-hydrolysing)
MALSGLGGDELFAGYNTFNRLWKFRRKNLLSIAPQRIRRQAGKLVEYLNPGIRANKLSAILVPLKWIYQTFIH